MNPVLLLLSLSVASVGLSIRAVEPMLPVLAAEFAVTVPAAAQVITVFALLYALGQFAHGPLGDRYGRLPVIAIMMIGAAGSFLGCALAADLTSLTVWRAAAGAFSAAPFILGMAYLADTVAMEQRQTTIAQFVTGNVIGHASGPLLSGILTDTFGWRAMFVLLTGLFALVGVTIFAVSRSAHGVERHAELRGSPIARYIEVVKLPKVRMLAWVSMAEAFFFFGAYAYLGALLKDRFDLSYTLIGLALAGFGVGGLLFNVFIRQVLKRLNMQGLVLWGGLSCGLLYITMAGIPVWPPVYLLMIAIGFTFYMVHNVLQTRSTEAAPQARGIGMSVFGISWTIGQSMGVALMGAGVAAFGFAPMIAAFGVGFVLLGVWMRFNLHRLP